MANVKAVRIEAVVPFDFVEEASDVDAARLGRLLLTPSIGLHHAYTNGGMRPNPATGGRTKLYRLVISGEEALSFPYLDELRAMLGRMGAAIERFDVIDMEG